MMGRMYREPRNLQGEIEAQRNHDLVESFGESLADHDSHA